jgi:hypothetical protein
MVESLPDWPRHYFSQAGGNPFIFYVVYGRFENLPPLSASQYRSQGVPFGFDLTQYDSEKHSDVLARFRMGYLWDQLVATNPVIAAQIAQSNECFVLKGECHDCDSLNYLRDCIGLLTFPV